jgi:hypothetical protein
MLNKIYLSLSILFFCAINISAQFGTTDTLETKRTYTEINFWSGVQSHRNGGEQIYGGRFTYGLTKKVEIGINGSFSNPNDTDFPPEIQPNVKWKVYENEKHRVAVAGGLIAFVPVAKRLGTNTFAMVYGNISKQVRQLKSARFTAGVYGLVGRNNDFGAKKGWNFNYEQPLTRKVSFSTQWVTGKNRFGYVTPGFSIAMPKNSNLFIGYSVGNYDYDNHGPYISYSFSR